MLRIRTDGFNENQIEAESKGKGEHSIGITMVVSRAISLFNESKFYQTFHENSWNLEIFKYLELKIYSIYIGYVHI